MDPFREIAAIDLPDPEIVTSLGFGAGGKTLLVGSGSWSHVVPSDSASGGVLDGKGRLRSVDLEAPTKITVLGEHDSPIGFVGVSPKGDRAVTASQGTSKVWDLFADGLRDNGAGTIVQRFGFSTSEDYGAGGFSIVAQSSQVLKLVQTNGEVQVSDFFTGKSTPQIEIPNTVEHWAVDSGFGRMVISSGNRIEAWDLYSTNRIATFRGHTRPIKSLALSQDGRWALSSDGSQAKLWDLARGGSTVRLKPERSPWSISSVVFGRAPESIVAADSGGFVRVWDTEGRMIVSEWRSPRGAIDQLVMNPEATTLALLHTHPEPRIEIYDFLTQRIIQTLRPSNLGGTWPRQISLTPDGKSVLVVTLDGMETWDVITGKMRTNIVRRGVQRAVLSPTASFIAVAAVGLELWESKSLASITLADRIGQTRFLIFSSDNTKIAVGSGSEISLWDIKERSLKGRLHGPDDWFTSGVFSPDGTRFISGGSDGTVRIWDIGTQTLLLTLREHTRVVMSLAITPDGKELASASIDGSVIVWKAEFPGTDSEAKRHQLELKHTVGRLLERLFDEHFLASNVVERLEHDESLTEEIRAEAIRISRGRDDTNIAEELNGQSWDIVSASGRERSEYERAIRQAQAACAIRQVPHFFNTLGVAYYRAGHYDEALVALSKADQLNHNAYNRATDLLFMAMAHYRAGHTKEAHDLLQQARPLMNNVETSWLNGIASEADALINAETH